MNLKSDPLSEAHDFKKRRLPRTQEMMDLCRTPDSRCAEALDDEGAIHTMLQSEKLLVGRYQELIKYSEWLETVRFDLSAPLPRYSDVMDGQRLLFATASVLARQGKHAQLQELMSSDLRFWRRVSEKSDILISKMIAVAAIRQHFKLGNLVVRGLFPDGAARAIPKEWREEVSDSERSMLRVLVGEWTLGSNFNFESVKEVETLMSDLLDEEHSFADRIVPWLLSPTFQRQDFNNRRAEFLSSLADVANVPLNEYGRATERARQLVRNLENDAARWSALYNRLGRMWLAEGAENFIPYAARVADVEGIRRAAVLIVTARSAGTDSRAMKEYLSKSEIRNPYNNEALTWDPESQSVVFVGLQDGDAGRYAFLY